jgi:Lar family restriction alleviation protein
MSELEQCPFCGSWEVSCKGQDMIPAKDACSHAPDMFQIHWVQCNDCGAHGPVMFKQEDAIDKWNRWKR